MDSFRFVNQIQELPVALYYRVFDTFLVAVFNESMGSNLELFWLTVQRNTNSHSKEVAGQHLTPHPSQETATCMTVLSSLSLSHSALTPSPQENVLTHVDSGSSHLD